MAIPSPAGRAAAPAWRARSGALHPDTERTACHARPAYKDDKEKIGAVGGGAAGAGRPAAACAGARRHGHGAGAAVHAGRVRAHRHGVRHVPPGGDGRHVYGRQADAQRVRLPGDGHALVARRAVYRRERDRGARDARAHGRHAHAAGRRLQPLLSRAPVGHGGGRRARGRQPRAALALPLRRRGARDEQLVPDRGAEGAGDRRKELCPAAPWAQRRIRHRRHVDRPGVQGL